MKKITLSIDDKVLEAARDYARSHDMTLDLLIGKLISKTVFQPSVNWLECFQLMDRANVNSDGKRWKREELY